MEEWVGKLILVNLSYRFCLKINININIICDFLQSLGKN